MTDTRKDALNSLALFAKGLIPTEFNAHDFEPTYEDIISLQNDLLIIANRVDRVIEAYGVKLLNNGIIDAHDVKECFTNVLENALTGNALYCIESGISKRIEERAA